MHQVVAGVLRPEGRMRPEGRVDAEGVESGGLTAALSGGCGEDVAKVASGGSQETGEARKAEPRARARERDFCTCGPSLRVSERRWALREWKTVCGNPLLGVERVKEWPGKTRKNSSSQGRRRGEEDEREMTGCSLWRLAPAFPS